MVMWISCKRSRGGVDIILNINKINNIYTFEQWKDEQVSSSLNDGPGHLSSFSPSSKMSFLQVYGDAYALALEICRMCANLDRAYRYSLGEEIRFNAIRMVLDIDTASKSKVGTDSIVSAEKRLCEIQLCLRILSDLGSIPKKRHVSFIEMTDNISRQLAAWENSRQKRSSVGVPVQ